MTLVLEIEELEKRYGSTLAVDGISFAVEGMALFFPLMFLSGAAMPRQIMPESVRAFGDRLPLTQVVDLLQGLWLGQPLLEHGVQLAWLTAMLVIGTTVSVRFFRWE